MFPAHNLAQYPQFIFRPDGDREQPGVLRYKRNSFGLHLQPFYGGFSIQHGYNDVPIFRQLLPSYDDQVAVVYPGVRHAVIRSAERKKFSGFDSGGADQNFADDIPLREDGSTRCDFPDHSHRHRHRSG